MSRSRSRSRSADREVRPVDADMGSDESTSLLVRNLNFKSSPEDVKKAFSEHGEVRDVYLPLDYHTRRPRGFGFVEFVSASDAKVACRSLDSSILDGSKIEVCVAKQNRKSPGTMRRVTKPDSRGGRDEGYRRERSYDRRSRSRGGRDSRREGGRGGRSRSRSGRRRERSHSRGRRY